MKPKLTIKQQLLILVEQTLDAQNEKGMKNYGQTLDECPNDDYEWQNMQIEELLDALQYSIKENRKLSAELKEANKEILLQRATMDHIYSTL